MFKCTSELAISLPDCTIKTGQLHSRLFLLVDTKNDMLPSFEIEEIDCNVSVRSINFAFLPKDIVFQAFRSSRINVEYI